MTRARIMAPMDDWAYYIGAPPAAMAVTCVTTVIMYAVFIAFTRIMGQRVLAKLSGYDLLLVIVMGALIGRTMIGWVPTLATGLTALVTLLVLEVVVGRFSRNTLVGRLVNNTPVLLLAGGEYLDDEMRRTHVRSEEILSRLRLAGIRDRSEAAAVILEPTGELAVLRAGEPIHPELLAGVRSAGRMPAHLLVGS